MSWQVLNKKKRAKFIDFQKNFLTPFCKKGLGLPAKSSLMSGFKDGGGVIVPGYLQFTALGTRLTQTLLFFIQITYCAGVMEHKVKLAR